MQLVKYPALLQPWCRSKLWLKFDPWPGNFHMLWVQPKKKKGEKERNCCSLPSLQQPSPWSVSSHQWQGKTLHQQKDYDSLKAQIIAFFINKIFLIKIYALFFRHNAWTLNRWQYSVNMTFFFWPPLCYAEVPGPGIKPTPQQWPKPQQWQCQILNH